jgi:serine/threonine-protein kinase
MTLDQKEVVDALPSYEIGGELGRGGWGVVLSGRHRQLEREVAIKQLPRAFAADEAVRARFAAEARVLASLDHPHIVPVYDYVERDGLCLLVMEKLPGGTLWTRFSTQGFTPPAATAAVLATIAGLQAAHDHHVLHRDIKPENLMFSNTGALKVTDFGIAKVIGGEGTLATRAGEVVGTPAYIAPEQARGTDLSPATDVYAVATMFYELLSGQLPFDDDGDAMALLFKHAFEAPTPLRDKAPFVPEAVADVVMRGLATDPADRYESAEAFGLAIAEACTTAWGPGWLAAEGTPVMGASSIVAVTERVSAPPRGPTLADAVPAAPEAAGASPAPPRTPAPPTVADVSPASPPAPPLAAAAQMPAPAPAAPVRPTVATHAGGVQLDRVAEADLVPVKEVMVPPAKATWPLLLTALLLLLTVVLALVGIGSPSTGGDLPAGSVRIAGVDPTSGKVVELDLSKPVPVVLGAGAPSADRARLTLGALGQRVTQSSAPLRVAGHVASIDTGSSRYLVGGRLTAQLDLVKGSTVVGHVSFVATTSQLGLISAAGAGVVLLLLFALAYAESFARSLRRGRRIATATAGLVVMGALIGIGIVGLVWVLGVEAPTIATLVGCAVLGGGAGAAMAVGARRVGRARRFAALKRREQAA